MFICDDRKQRKYQRSRKVLFCLISILSPLMVFAADNVKPAPVISSGKPTPQRNFYEVLDDVLADFEYDLKNGQVEGLKDLSIRNMAVSENIPPSFKSHLELSITERIMKNTKTKMIQCLPCRAKKTSVNGDQVIITSAETNPVELSRIAKVSGILHFMDVAFSYQPSGMVLSMYITEPESGGIVWSRSYNSEVSRAAAFRRGVDYSQIDEARKANEYVPAIQHRLITYYFFEPNVSGMTGCLGFGYRMVERYDNRKKEVGFEFNYIKDSNSLVSSSAAGATNLYSGFNLTLIFVHAWNFIGPEENYNLIRGSLALAAGGTYASGYLGGLIRATYEWRLARHWRLSTVLGFRPPATAFTGGKSAGSVTGAEIGLGVNFLF
ncbi:MAG: hypothetical protein A3K03_04370 [Bdellovibrionales bacterium RIFOXYD1_FULL_44_7]|nr:MAG: hypothetical protein A3K03_04370 [Bdellovibrionales bacterium RIFOXYD1_FULL_44_7]